MRRGISRFPAFLMDKEGNVGEIFLPAQTECGRISFGEKQMYAAEKQVRD